MGSSGYTKFGVGLDPDEKRRRIQEAAETLFGRLGYQKATVKDILAEAGISRRTFYAYFESKEDVLVHLMDEFAESMKRIRDLETPDRVGDVDELRAQIARLAESLTSELLANRDLIKVVLEGLLASDETLRERSRRIVDTFYAFIREYVEVAQAKGLIHGGNVSVIGTILLGIYLEVMRRVLILKDPTPLEAWVGEILALIYRGYVKEPDGPQIPL